ncbi:MAG: YebC/PmpR family DNA-binding transcriptional regulator [Clostridiales bacterium]|nr:YebC/PmpR family DNA-binding transcriptional regulator [Clostridiales bacterium]
MSGHSKWANIRRKKEKSDAKRGKIFTKLGRELAVAVREGGPNPDTNNKLKDVIAKAKAANMSNDNIMRSIKKASGEAGNVTYDEVLYEGYGPSGIAFMVEAMTDNRNRTAAEIRHVFDKSGGQMGQSGSVAWMFERKGVLIVEKTEGTDEDTVMMAALEAGAEDMQSEEDVFEIQTVLTAFGGVRTALEEQGMNILSAELEWIPQSRVDVDGEASEKLEKLIDMLEDSDDVQSIYHNANIDA